MTPTRRLAACALVTTLLGTLTACGGDNPLGRILTGSGSTTPSTASSTPASSSTSDPGTASPGDTQSTDASWTSTSPDTMSPTSTSSQGDPSMSPGTMSSSTAPEPGASGSSGVTTAPTSGSPTGADQQGSVVQIDGRTIQGVPVGLAFPQGAKIEGNSEFAGGGGTVVLSAPAENQLFTYYRSALPGAGYRIVSDTAGVLAFSGHGFRGTIVGTGTGGVLTWSPMQH